MTLSTKDVKRDLKGSSKNNVFLVAVLLISLVAELLLSNASFLYMKTGGYKEQVLDINSAVADGDTQISDGRIFAAPGSVLFKDVGTEMKNLYLEVTASETGYDRLSINFTDDTCAYMLPWESNSDDYKIWVAPDYGNKLNKSSYGKVRDLALFFSKPEVLSEPYTITSVTVNKMPDPGFNLMRFLVFVIAGFLIYKKAWYGKNKAAEKQIIAGLGAFTAILVILISFMMQAGSEGAMLDAYPLKDPYINDQYELMFDAFHNGRTSVNVKITESVWDSLDNPYDYSERGTKGVDKEAWDRAYYDGNFYSYFGVAPVFIIYYPVYLLTGSLPSSMLASALTTCLTILFITVLYLELTRRFFDDIPSFFVVLGYTAVEFGSLIFALWTDSYFYFIAVNFGIGALAAFLAFLLKAYYSGKFVKRVIYLVLTGISIVMIATSRPSLLIYCAAAIVPLICVIRDRSESRRNKIIYIAAAAVPAMIGAAGVMAYNNVRFGNPFEFGFNYQITVSNPKANNIMASLFPFAVYHYYLQAPDLSTVFPYISVAVKELSSYPRHTYIFNNIGAFFFPLSLGIFAVPALFTRKKNGFREYFFITILACAVALSFIDMCKAGVHYRYVADILMPLLIVGLVSIFDVMKKIKDTDNKKLLSLWNGTVTLLLILTVVMGFLMIFANENKFLVIPA